MATNKPDKPEAKSEKTQVFEGEGKARKKVVLASDKEALKRIKLVAVAH